MTAATQDRSTQSVIGQLRAFGVEAGARIYAGTLVCLNAAGNLTKGATSATLKCVGIAERAYDNTTGGAGAITGETRIGVFGPFANSAAADLITPLDIGNACFMVDDSTVAKTNGGATRSAAGAVWSVEAAGVYIKFS